MKKRSLTIITIIALATASYFTVNSGNHSEDNVLSSNVEALANTAAPTIPCRPDGESCTYRDNLESGHGIEITLYGLQQGR